MKEKSPKTGKKVSTQTLKQHLEFDAWMCKILREYEPYKCAFYFPPKKFTGLHQAYLRLFILCAMLHEKTYEELCDIYGMDMSEGAESLEARLFSHILFRDLIWHRMGDVTSLALNHYDLQVEIFKLYAQESKHVFDLKVPYLDSRDTRFVKDSLNLTREQGSELINDCIMICDWLYWRVQVSMAIDAKKAAWGSFFCQLQFKKCKEALSKKKYWQIFFSGSMNDDHAIFFLDAIFSLDGINRWISRANGEVYGNYETVLEHIIKLCRAGFSILSPHYRRIEPRDYVLMSLIHDMGEIFLGDMASYQKKGSFGKKWKAEDEAMFQEKYIKPLSQFIPIHFISRITELYGLSVKGAKNKKDGFSWTVFKSVEEMMAVMYCLYQANHGQKHFIKVFDLLWDTLSKRDEFMKLPWIVDFMVNYRNMRIRLLKS
ncbi:MAG: HD domain-containing protein [Parcubacteria group bacterium]|nr:HD domain-containing protein [Parcubacteria group bacterium]